MIQDVTLISLTLISPVRKVLIRSALLAVVLMIPFFFIGLYLFNPHGSIETPVLKIIGLVLIFPSMMIQDAGTAYSLGSPWAFILILITQFLWTFAGVALVYILQNALFGKRAANV